MPGVAALAEMTRVPPVVAFQPDLLTVTLLLSDVTVMSLSRSTALTLTLAVGAASPSVALRLTFEVETLSSAFLAILTLTAICFVSEPDARVTMAL